MQLEDSSAFGAHPANCETAHIHLSTFEMEIVGTVAQLFLLRHVVVVGTQFTDLDRPGDTGCTSGGGRGEGDRGGGVLPSVYLGVQG